MNGKSQIEIEQLLAELITYQQAKLLAAARQIIPDATADDILQPNDFPELENHPNFRYEEGLLHGLLAFQTALRAE